MLGSRSLDHPMDLSIKVEDKLKLGLKRRFGSYLSQSVENSQSYSHNSNPPSYSHVRVPTILEVPHPHLTLDLWEK